MLARIPYQATSHAPQLHLQQPQPWWNDIDRLQLAPIKQEATAVESQTGKHLDEVFLEVYRIDVRTSLL